VLLMKDTLWENNLYFVKDMSTICVNLRDWHTTSYAKVEKCVANEGYFVGK